MTDPLSSCPDCGAPLPPDSPQALCPACLMRQALASRTVADGGNPAPASPPLTPEELAEKFPGYEILQCLGRGGMGVVYKARQKSLNRLVAIKILAPERGGESRFAERFAREAELLAKLNHPHIVTIHDFGETGGLFYLVMEYVDGVNLRDLLRDGKLEAKQALAIVPPICDALQYAHEKGIVHRDIKPENLLLDREGRVKIADFGIAKLIEPVASVHDRRTSPDENQRRSQGAATLPAGTLGYSAPEQAEGTVDQRADIYSLGVVLYEMLTGERPAKELVAPSKRVQLDVRIDEIVLRALEKTPELRYQTVAELRTRVETITSDKGSAEVPPASSVAASDQPTRQASPKVSMGRLIAGFLIFGVLMAIREEFHETWLRAAMAGIAAISGFLVVFSRRLDIATHPRAAGMPDGGASLHVLEFRTAMDLGNYAQAWEAAAPMFQQSNNKEEWVARMEAVRRPLGQAVGGKIRSQHVTADHSRINQVLEINFDSGRTAIQSMSMAKHPDGDYKVIRYDIKVLDAAELGADVPPVGSRFSRKAIVGAFWLAFVPLHFLLPLILPPGWKHNALIELFAVLQALLFWTAPLGVTILGWIAVSHIRRSAGSLHGMWLAVCDGLFFPLLALDALILGLPFAALKLTPLSHGSFGIKSSFLLIPVGLVLLAFAVASNVIIIRRVWREVNSNNPAVPPQTSSTDKPARFPRKAILVSAYSCIVLSFAFLFTKWWNEHRREGVWTPARISQTITDQYGDAQVRVVDVSQVGQVVVMSFTCEMFRLDRRLIVQYGGPVLSYPNDLIPSVKSKVPDLDCLMAPKAKLTGDSMGEVLVGNNALSDRTMFRIGFVLPDSETAAKVVQAVQETHLGKPRGLGEGGSILLLFSLRRDSGKDATGKPVVEGLDATLWSCATSGVNQPLAQTVFGLQPVIELTFPMNEKGETDMLDPETGQIIPSPNRDGSQASRMGLLIRHDSKADKTELVGMNGVIPQESRADQWAEITNFQALETLKNNFMSKGGSVGAVMSGPAPHTFLFKTGNGRIGILQITGFTEDNRGVKIRYKLVRSPTRFIRRTGGYQLGATGSIVLTPSTDGKVTLAVTMVEGTSRDTNTIPDFCKKEGWFVYPETPQRVWIFDGIRQLNLLTPGGIYAANADIMAHCPQEVRDTLPESVRAIYREPPNTGTKEGASGKQSAFNPIPAEAARLLAELKSLSFTPAFAGKDITSPEVKKEFQAEVARRSAEVAKRTAAIEQLLSGTAAEPLVKQQKDLLRQLAENSEANPANANAILQQLHNQRKQLDAMIEAAAERMPEKHDVSNPGTGREQPAASSAVKTLQFRWVAAQGDAESPVDVFPDPNDPSCKQTLRVLREVVLNQTDIEHAEVTKPAGRPAGPQINFEETGPHVLRVSFSEAGAEKLAAATKTMAGRQLAIIWMDHVISAPRIMAPITGRSMDITGYLTNAEISELRDALNAKTEPAFTLRWVSKPDDQNTVEIAFAANEASKLRVSRTWMLAPAMINSVGWTAWNGENKTLFLTLKNQADILSIQKETTEKSGQALAVLWQGKVIGLLPVTKPLSNGLKIPLVMSDQNASELERELKSSAEAKDASKVIHIRITEAGTLMLEDQHCPPNQLGDKLRKLAEKNAITVVINAEEKAPFQHVNAILDICKVAGFSDVKLATP